MKDRLNLIGNMLVDMLAVYGILVLSLKYFPLVFPFQISLEVVSIFVLVLYVLKVIFTKSIKIKQPD